MMSKKSKKLTKQQIREKHQLELERVLVRTGYLRLKAKHGTVQIDRFPNLKVDSSHLPELSNSIGNGYVVHTGANHPDAIQFPVGNSHKQGLELIYSKDYISQMNGKKT